jgi:flagellar FliL protein
MAEEENESATENQAAGKSGIGLMKLLMFAAIGMGVLIGGQLGTLILAKSMMPDLIYPEWMMALAPEPEIQEAEEEEELQPPIYTKMNPPVVVSYQTGDSVRFLQITMEAMARSEESIDSFQLHSPHIRNNLLLLFASESLEKLSTVEGKELMRQASLREINEILQSEDPGAEIEDLYFTAFVVQ